jgi:hypothetical protein
VDHRRPSVSDGALQAGADGGLVGVGVERDERHVGVGLGQVRQRHRLRHQYPGDDR